MHRRIPGSMRTRHEFSDPVEGRLSSAGARGQLLELATRLIIEEAPFSSRIRSELKGNTERLETLAREMLVTGPPSCCPETTSKQNKNE